MSGKYANVSESIFLSSLKSEDVWTIDSVIVTDSSIALRHAGLVHSNFWNTNIINLQKSEELIRLKHLIYSIDGQ